MKKLLGAAAATALLFAFGGPAASAAQKAPVDLGQKVNNHGTKDVSGKSSASLTLEQDDKYFEPTFIKVQPGEKLTITLKNEGKLAHTFTSTALKVDKEVQPDKKAKVTVTVPSTGAAFQFHCDFHESSGMAGAMFTTAGASVSSSGATATTNPTATNSSKSSSGGY
ncbi:MAG TPA: cupredoxin domain-containing protein [Acidimicrobiia bacterium]|nr:cupredoxin domain-containing protein [Acidimicrobiia bacterium]